MLVCIVSSHSGILDVCDFLLGGAMLLIGSKIPAFSAEAVTKEKRYVITHTDLLGSYTLLFFYALDFSYVCPGEVNALQDKLEEFTRRGCKVIAASVDSIYTHNKCLNTERNKLGVSGVTFPLISDMSHKLSKAFSVLDKNKGISLRASFIIDEENTIQYGSANSVAFGRSIGELIRLLDAIQSIRNGTEQYCEVNWKRRD